MDISVIGIGMVGGTLVRYLEECGHSVKKYDPPKGIGSVEEINSTDIIFVCVPTPYSEIGGYDLTYVRDSLNIIKAGKIVDPVVQTSSIRI